MYAIANCRHTALHVCMPNTKPSAARRGRRGGAAPVLAAVENCEAVCRLVGWRRMRGAWDAWCCYSEVISGGHRLFYVRSVGVWLVPTCICGSKEWVFSFQRKIVCGRR